MNTLTLFWLPILVSAAAVWVASAIAWMAIGHHKEDFKGLPNEQAFRDFVKSSGVGAGNFGFPHFADKKECHTPEGKAKWASGPVGTLTVWGKISMGRNMALTFIVYLVVSYVIAYLLGSSGIRHGTEFMQVFKIAGTAGILAYCFAGIPNAIWFGAYPRTIALNIIDGIVYGLITRRHLRLALAGALNHDEPRTK
jgi:hypothetical protein